MVSFFLDFLNKEKALQLLMLQGLSVIKQDTSTSCFGADAAGYMFVVICYLIFHFFNLIFRSATL